MTKFRIGDIVRVKPRKIKKYDPGKSLQEAWEHKYAKPKHITPTEEEFMASAAQIKPQAMRYREKMPKTMQTAANVLGDDPRRGPIKFQPLDPVHERVERISQNIEFKVASQKLNKARSAYKNIATKNPKRFLAKPPKIGKTLPETDWAHSNKKLTKVILTARRHTKPKSVLTEGIGERPRTVLIGPMQEYKGIGPARTGAELKRKYEKVSQKAMLHASGAGAQFTKQVQESGKPIRRVKELQKQFLRKKKGGVSSERAFEMGFPQKTGSGQYEPFSGLESYNPFKGKGTRLTGAEETAIARQRTALYADIKKLKPGEKRKPGQPIGTIKRAFAKQFGKDREQATQLIPQEGYWSKGKFTKYKGKALKDQYGRTYFFRKQHISPRNMAENKFVQKTISKKTQALYPSLSQDQKWFKRVSKEWSKKKGRTPFDF